LWFYHAATAFVYFTILHSLVLFTVDFLRYLRCCLPHLRLVCYDPLYTLPVHTIYFGPALRLLPVVADVVTAFRLFLTDTLRFVPNIPMEDLIPAVPLRLGVIAPTQPVPITGLPRTSMTGSTLLILFPTTVLPFCITLRQCAHNAPSHFTYHVDAVYY